LDNSRTFSDDSFRITEQLVVTGTLPGWAELRWYPDLVRFCGADLKWGRVRDRWPDLSSELRRSILRDLRDALIAIIDGSLYHSEWQRIAERVARRPRASWPEAFGAWVDERSRDYEMRRILDDSPAWRIQEYLADDGDILADIGGIAQNTDIERTLLTDLQARLEKPHNVRLFGARSAAAFAHVLNRDDWAKAIDYLRDVRYFMPQRLMGQVLAMGERTQRIFDEGNKKSVAGINSLKAAIRERLQASRVIFLSTEPLTNDASEEPSHSQPMLQAADLAGGYARQIYLDYGLRGVCEEFKGVIHNGKMIRTWLQIERVDGDLRPRRR